MGIFIIGIIIISILYSIYEYKKEPGNKIEKELRERYLQYGYHYIESLNVKYMGGIPNISVNSKNSFEITKEGLLILTATNSTPYLGGSKETLVPWGSIKNVSFQNEKSIQQQVSLGKLLVFGVLAFGMEGKEKSINNEYLVLEVEDKKNYSIILQPKDRQNNQTIYNNIIEYKEVYK